MGEFQSSLLAKLKLLNYKEVSPSRDSETIEVIALPIAADYERNEKKKFRIGRCTRKRGGHKNAADKNNGQYLSGRGDRIRTCDLFTPSEARYQAALRPDIFLSAGAFCQRWRFWQEFFELLMEFTRAY